MALRTVDDLIEALQKAQLLSPSRMDVLVMSLRAGFVSPALLAEDLVLKRWLTLYQVTEIFRGRARGLVLGKYLLLERLGAGGMAVVFKAQHRRLRRTDALKVVRPERLADPRVLPCFLHEAQAAARLSHPNVVTVYDAGEAGGRLFLAMEYVEGTDLERLVQGGGPLPVARACAYARQAALGIQHAHDRGLVHRDLKPSNLLLAADRDVVKVVDFGMALLPRLPRKAAAAAARTVMGTPDYLAPEQAADPWKVDGRADVYALGCTLYFLLAGRPPFPGGSAEDKLRRHREARPTRLERLRPDVPPGLARVVRHTLRKRPASRIPTLQVVAEALAPFC
jgi:serine/threonine-protein kinase